MAASSIDLDRQGLAALLGPSLAGAAITDKAAKALIAGSGTVKTYTVEVNAANGEAPEVLARQANALGFEVLATSDSDLFMLRGDRLSFFVDLLDPRFWLLHTASGAGRAKQAVRRLVWDSRQVDSCWFPQSLLRSIQASGTSRWFKADFKGEGFLPHDGVADRRLRVQLEGDHPDVLFDLLASLEAYRTAAALSAVACRIGGPDDWVDEIAHFNGGFVARGRSFENHVGFVAEAVDRYRKLVERVENRYRLSWSAAEHGGLTFDGDVLTISLSRRVTDLDQLLDGLFSCRDPFRLWAVPRKITDDFATAEVVDLHIGEAFSMDIGTDYIRVYLSDRVCGNTVLRLLTNLQHRYDATSSAAPLVIDPEMAPA